MKLFLTVFFIIFIVFGCDLQRNSWEASKAVDLVFEQLENREKYYFKINYSSSDKGISNKLNGFASYQAGKGGYIGSAYFNLNNQKNYYFLNSVGDEQNPLFLIEGNNIDYNSAEHLNDSIYSPVLVNAYELKSYLSSANKIESVYDSQTQDLSLTFVHKSQTIVLLYDTRHNFVKRLEIAKSSDTKISWAFQLLNAEEYKQLSVVADQLVDREKRKFL